LFIVGISLLYGFIGSTNFTFIGAYLDIVTISNLSAISTYGIFVGGLFIFIGLLFKLGVAPFHF